VVGALRVVLVDTWLYVGSRRGVRMGSAYLSRAATCEDIGWGGWVIGHALALVSEGPYRVVRVRLVVMMVVDEALTPDAQGGKVLGGARLRDVEGRELSVDDLKGEIQFDVRVCVSGEGAAGRMVPPHEALFLHACDACTHVYTHTHTQASRWRCCSRPGGARPASTSALRSGSGSTG
jgi:hypothetical protein